VVYNVFISHTEAEEDKPIIDRCVDWLKANDISYYLAELSLNPIPLTDKIEKAIRAADSVLIVQTQKGAMSTWVQQEAAIARTLKKPVIVLVEKGVKVKGVLRDIAHVVFDRFDVDKAFSKVTDYFINARNTKEASERTSNFVLGMLALMFIVGFAGLAVSGEG